MPQQSGTAQLTVSWGRCTGGNWCPLATVDLAHEAFDADGVYLVWHGGAEPRVVYVGQGELRERLTARRDDERVLAYSSFGLYVTWAVVGAADRDGVEFYLADLYKPLVGERHPDVAPIRVNSLGD